MAVRDDRSCVLAGYDGSEDGNRVLRWAATEAQLRYLPLTVCHAYRWPFPTPPGDDGVLMALAGAADAVVNRGVLIARRFAPTVKIEPWPMHGSASAVLVERSAGADLVVVGARGSGGFADLPLGSVAHQVVGYASCPVLVVRDSARPPDGQGRIVVGTDGSPGDEAAVAFAFEEAALRRVALHVVHARSVPDPAAQASESSGRFHSPLGPFVEKYPQVETRTWWSDLDTIDALLAAAHRETLLVVVDRRAGGFRPLPVGPTAQAMVHLAPCPVAVT